MPSYFRSRGQKIVLKSSLSLCIGFGMFTNAMISIFFHRARGTKRRSIGGDGGSIFGIAVRFATACTRIENRMNNDTTTYDDDTTTECADGASIQHQRTFVRRFALSFSCPRCWRTGERTKKCDGAGTFRKIRIICACAECVEFRPLCCESVLVLISKPVQ